jgi:hypothetical protein
MLAVKPSFLVGVGQAGNISVKRFNMLPACLTLFA